VNDALVLLYVLFSESSQVSQGRSFDKSGDR
jgi:hypothetical protein